MSKGSKPNKQEQPVSGKQELIDACAQTLVQLRAIQNAVTRIGVLDGRYQIFLWTGGAKLVDIERLLPDLIEEADARMNGRVIPENKRRV